MVTFWINYFITHTKWLLSLSDVWHIVKRYLSPKQAHTHTKPTNAFYAKSCNQHATLPRRLESWFAKRVRTNAALFRFHSTQCARYAVFAVSALHRQEWIKYTAGSFKGYIYDAHQCFWIDYACAALQPSSTLENEIYGFMRYGRTLRAAKKGAAFGQPDATSPKGTATPPFRRFIINLPNYIIW